MSGSNWSGPRRFSRAILGGWKRQTSAPRPTRRELACQIGRSNVMDALVAWCLTTLPDRCSGPQPRASPCMNMSLACSPLPLSATIPVPVTVLRAFLTRLKTVYRIPSFRGHNFLLLPTANYGLRLLSSVLDDLFGPRPPFPEGQCHSNVFCREAATGLRLDGC